jgi:hypothetical protein
MRNDRESSLWTDVAEELRRLALQCCCAAGGLAGLWFGFLAAPKQDSSPHLLDALAQVLVPVGWRVGLGVLLGAVAAWLLVAIVPALRLATQAPGDRP